MYKKIGIILILASLIFSSINISFTGAVIGIGAYNYMNFLGVLFFIGGILLLYISSTLESRVSKRDYSGPLVRNDSIMSPEGLLDRVNFLKGDNPEFVTDTSFIGSYTKEGLSLVLEGLSRKGVVVVTDSVLKELRGPVSDLKQLVEETSVGPYEKFFRKKATEYLNESRKKFYYEEIIPILTEEKSPPKSRRDSKHLVEATHKLLRYLNEEGKPLTRENLIGLVEKHYNVSDTDVDVLASALASISKGKEVYILERDVDFEDAINSTELKDKIHFINPYK